jgi:hypothetical protein
MTPNYLEYFNNNNNNNDNLTNIINNLMYNFNNHNIIDNPIDQITPCPTNGIPVVDGYIFNGWDINPKIVRGSLINESVSYFNEEIIPVGSPVVIGSPIFPPWALDVCIIRGNIV